MYDLTVYIEAFEIACESSNLLFMICESLVCVPHTNMLIALFLQVQTGPQTIPKYIISGKWFLITCHSLKNFNISQGLCPGPPKVGCGLTHTRIANDTS